MPDYKRYWLMLLAEFALAEIGVIVTVAIMGSIIMRQFKQNELLGYILAGMLLGPLGLGFLKPYTGVVQIFGDLGLFVLMFYLGLELSLKKFIEAGPSALILAFADMIALTGGAFLLVYSMGFSPLFAIIVGIMVFCHSTAIVAKFVMDSKLTEHRGASIALAILIMEDFLAILLIVFVTSMSASGNAMSLGVTAVVFAVAMFSIVRRLSRRVEAYLISKGYGHEETSLYALGLGLLVSAVAFGLGISTTIGAYFAGFAMAETQAGHRIKHDLIFLRDFFILFFFVSFGTTLFVQPVYDATGALVSAIPKLPPVSELALLFGIALALAAVIIVGNFFVFGLIGKKIGLTNDEASMAATLLTPLGEFLVIIATTAAQAQILSPAEMAILSPLVFVMILVTVTIFQPFYNNRHHHRNAMQMFPDAPVVAKAKVKRSSEQDRNDATMAAISRLANNGLTLLCITGLVFFMYDSHLSLNLPWNMSRELTFGLIFVIVAAYPFAKMVKALVSVYRHLKMNGARGQLGLLKIR